MKVVLRDDVTGVGKRGDIVSVADGYARNNLIPSGSAIAASDGITDQAARMRSARDLRDAKDRDSAVAIAQRLVPMVITIAAKSGRAGKLFGSVTPTEIVTAVERQSSVVIDRHALLAHEPIKELGEHRVGVRLHHDVTFELQIEVVSE
ncbi:MAG TPA: 50S ribosomal protein L9 [Acidimicrobiales bacterium]|nr:50S ribosomal protein L9 [Acidimicrobiales bacterium]